MNPGENRFPAHVSMESILGFWSQVARTDRGFRGLQAKHSDDDAHSALDRYLFFFLCFFSLRDWLKTNTREAHDVWMSTFGSMEEWKFCRDISTRFKHLRVTYPALSVPFTFQREYVGSGQCRLILIGSGSAIPLLDIATTLRRELTAFIRLTDGRDLLPPRGRGI